MTQRGQTLNCIAYDCRPYVIVYRGKWKRIAYQRWRWHQQVQTAMEERLAVGKVIA